MRVFVTGTGRNGSATFYQACKHITNYTCGHESFAGQNPLQERGLYPNYPDNHIEIAPLTMSAAMLRIQDPSSFWVHLVRDRKNCIRSLSTQCVRSLRAYATQWLLNYSADPYWLASRYYDDCVATTMDVLPSTSLLIRLEDIKRYWRAFWFRIGAEGDIEASLRCLDRNYNATYCRGLDNYVDHEPLLSIITLSLPERRDMLDELCKEVERQAGEFEKGTIQHLVIEDNGKLRYGEKMQKSIMLAKGRYVAWVDDDDWIAPTYVREIIGAISMMDPEVITFCKERIDIGLKIRYVTHGVSGGEKISEKERVHRAGHLCVWKRSLASLIPWLPYRFGPEIFWAACINHAFPYLNEFHIDKILYLHRYSAERTRCQREEDQRQSLPYYDPKVRCYREFDTGNIYISEWPDRETKSFILVTGKDGKGKTIHREKLEVIWEGTVNDF